MVGNHLFEKMRIADLPREQWKGELQKLPPEVKDEIAPWLRMQWRIIDRREETKEQNNRLKAHDHLVTESKRKKR